MKQYIKFIKSEKRYGTEEIAAILGYWKLRLAPLGEWDEWQKLSDDRFVDAVVARLRAADKLCGAAQRKINIQAMDEGLWFVAITASEEYLQNALRELHAIIKQAIAGYEKGQS